MRGAHADLTVYPPSRTFELLAFDEYYRFDTSAFFGYIKRASLYLPKEFERKQKYQNGNIHRKLTVQTSEREGKLSNLRARRARSMHIY